MIKVWDYLKEYGDEKEEIQAAIESVLSSGWLILGEQVKAFEKAFAGYCGVSYGVGVNSGTDALFLALKSLGIGPGDEVITVSFTFNATVSVILQAGARPVFVLVWNWYTVRPVVRTNRNSGLGTSGEGTYSAPLRKARPAGSIARYSDSLFAAPSTRSWPNVSQ